LEELRGEFPASLTAAPIYGVALEAVADLPA
jgi:hypothetical protein